MQKSDIQILRTGANLLKDPVASDILPITGAGTIVGILYGGIGGGTLLLLCMEIGLCLLGGQQT